MPIKKTSVAGLVKSAADKINNPYWRAKCSYIKYYEKLPLSNKTIFVESQQGKEFSGNIYYIVRYIMKSEKYKDYRIIVSAWGRQNADRYTEKFSELGYDLSRISAAVVASDDYYRAMATAKYLINDNTFVPSYVKKRGQVYLNTWHGTPLKTLGRRIKSDAHSIGNVQKNFCAADYLLHPNKYTMEHMTEDYMIENLSKAKNIIGGYPRNQVFFKTDHADRLKKELGICGRRIYAYMPTWRGVVGNVGNSLSEAYMLVYLDELDKMLKDDEMLFVNLHPIAKKNVDFSHFVHIRSFPEGYETYEFLNAADVLVTDYSSVFFDFACTRRKIVLFPYDKEDYLADRGMYMSLDELPFPQAYDARQLLTELRSEKNYDDSEFVDRFCHYDGADAAKKLCDYVILGEDTGLEVTDMPDNGKENVVIYAGNLAKNGITTSLRSLLNSIDTTKRNYYISFGQRKVKNYADQLFTFNENVRYFAIAEEFNASLIERGSRKLLRDGRFSAAGHMKTLKRRYEQEWLRAYGRDCFDTAIQFNGYESDVIIMYSAFKGRNIIFVHSDMRAEIKTRSNQLLSVIKYAYNNYDKVAVVSKAMASSTRAISGRNDNICLVNNTVDYKSVLERSELPIELNEDAECTADIDSLNRLLDSDKYVFINVGRFSPEKGHDRLVDAFARLHAENPKTALVIMGGNSLDDGYRKLSDRIRSMGLQDSVVLLLNISNPYPVIKKCSGFILSSLYEGFGLVLAEADILGLPIVSTDISGPRDFMKKYGGTLVENSEEGIYNGLRRLASNEIKTLQVDYGKYNRKCVEQFEKLFD